MSPERERSPLEGIQAEAYKAYLKAVRDGLANVDIDALDVTKGTASPASFPHCFCICYCYCYCYCFCFCFCVVGAGPPQRAEE
jgi:hypothetical protein